MSEKQRYETQRMDHHGIVAGLCHEVGLVEQIDQIVGRGERKVSCGEATLAMVLNRLGFSSRALYLMTDFLRNKPVDLLINPNLTAEDFNDDTLGRALDDLYEHGVTEVFAGVSARAMQLNPCWRDNSATGTPASASFKKRNIWCSLYRFRFISFSRLLFYWSLHFYLVLF
jgi:transposase